MHRRKSIVGIGLQEIRKKPIAVVFHINHDENTEGNGYAVYLWDLEPLAFADSIGVKQNTSADITALDGFENTFALLDARETSSPLAEKVFDLWRYGQSAMSHRWHRCACFIMPRSKSILLSRCAVVTRYPLKPMIAGTGQVRRSMNNRPPKHGSILWEAERFTIRPKYRLINQGQLLH